MKKIFTAFSFLVLAFFLGSTAAFADETEDEKNKDSMGFTVEAVIPSNQVDQSKSFFFLKTTPNAEQTIQVKVKSTRKEPRTLTVAVNNAMTSSEATIDYGVDQPELDDSLKIPLTDLVTVPDDFKEVTVENYEEKVIDLKIKAPAEPFAGIKLGAIRLIGTTDQNKAGLSVETGYTIGLVLTEDAAQYDLGGELTLKKVDVLLANGSKVVGVTLQNAEPKVIDGLKLHVKIRKKDSDKVLFEKKGTDLAVAPNTSFMYQIPMGIEQVQAGKYLVDITAENAVSNWKWMEEITITEETADKINEETIDKVLTPSWVPAATIVLTVIFAILIFLIVQRSRKIRKGIH